MKTMYNNFIIIIIALLLAGCSDFLEQTSQDQYVPKTATHFKELLQGEGYFFGLLSNMSNNGSYGFVAFMTDDVEYFDAKREIAGDGYNAPVASWTEKEADKVASLREVYTWQPDIENSDFINRSYRYLYRQVMVANMCLMMIDESEGTKDEKETVKGQAAFTRSFAYFILANLYAKPYSKAKPDDWCVPVKADYIPSVVSVPRATIKEVWDIITQDIEEALRLLENKKINNIYEISYPAALVLATRIYLYMEDWDKAIMYGEKFRQLGKYPVYDISDKTTTGAINLSPSQKTIFKFNNPENTEVAWSFGYDPISGSSDDFRRYINDVMTTTGVNAITRYFRVSSKASDGIIRQYEDGDRRLVYWFYQPLKGAQAAPQYRYNYFTAKAERDSHLPFLQGLFAFRTGEVYLSLIEAYARKASPDKSKAIALLNDLRVKRFDPAKYKALSASDFASDQALIDYIWIERRRELCFEELHRWWDLRRTTQPKIVHQWKDGATYTLQENDGAYVLDFPKKEFEITGSVLIPNPRQDKPQD